MRHEEALTTRRQPMVNGERDEKVHFIIVKFEEVVAGRLFGRIWWTSLSGDLGNGIFDGPIWSRISRRWSPTTLIQKRSTTFIRRWVPARVLAGSKLPFATCATQRSLRVDLRCIKSPTAIHS